MIVNFSKSGSSVVLTTSSGHYFIVLGVPVINLVNPMSVTIQTTSGLTKFNITSILDIQFNGTPALNVTDINNQISTLYTTSIAGSIVLTTTGTGVATIIGNNLNIPLSSGGGITGSASINAVAGQTAFTFPNVPATTTDYEIFKNGVRLNYGAQYSTNGNVVTITIASIGTDVISYQRIK